jgi:hypothetical protein
LVFGVAELLASTRIPATISFAIGLRFKEPVMVGALELRVEELVMVGGVLVLRAEILVGFGVQVAGAGIAEGERGAGLGPRRGAAWDEFKLDAESP